jgi:hypothetical protein
VLIGDSGGTVQEPDRLLYEDQNAITLLDKSGSVADSVQLAKNIALSLAQKYAIYAHDAFAAGQDVTIKFTVIPFSSDVSTAITVTATGPEDLAETSPGSGVWQFAGLVAAVNAINASGTTDFQRPSSQPAIGFSMITAILTMQTMRRSPDSTATIDSSSSRTVGRPNRV